MNRFHSNSSTNSSNVWGSQDRGSNDYYRNNEPERSVWQRDRREVYQNQYEDNGQFRAENPRNSSFLSFLENRSSNTQPREYMNEPEVSYSNDAFNNQRRYEDNSYGNNNYSAGSFSTNDFRSGYNEDLGRMRGPLLNNPSSMSRAQSSSQNFSQRNNEVWASSQNEGQRMTSEDTKPLKLTLYRKDVGQKIIGKHGALIKELQAKSDTRIEVINKPGTELAVIEIYGSNESQSFAHNLIARSCETILYVEKPEGKPRSLFDFPTSNSSSNNTSNRFKSYGNTNGSGRNSGQGLLKSPAYPVPNMESAYWRNPPKTAPKPLMSQAINGINLESNSTRNTSKPYGKRPQFNNSNKNRPFKNKKFTGNNRNGNANNKRKADNDNKQQNNGNNGTNNKKPKNDIYADADFAPAPIASLPVVNTDETSDENGWKDGLLDLTQALKKVKDDFVAPTKGTSIKESWTKTQNIVDHFAAGHFESGFKLLNSTYGIVNFEPYKTFAMSTYSGTQLGLKHQSEMSWNNVLLTRSKSDTESLPRILVQFSEVIKRLQQGYLFTTSGKFKEAVEVFRQILLSIPFMLTTNKAETAKVRKLSIICREYIMGLNIEMTRLKLPKVTLAEQKRNCELAAYFTRCNLQASHRMLTLSTALNLFFKLKNFKTAASFAKKLLDLEPAPDMIPQLNKIVDVCKGNLVDEHKLEFEDDKAFSFCSQTFKKMEAGSAETKCPFCHVRCAEECKGKVCTICTVAMIGKANADSSGDMPQSNPDPK